MIADEKVGTPYTELLYQINRVDQVPFYEENVYLDPEAEGNLLDDS